MDHKSIENEPKIQDYWSSFWTRDSEEDQVDEEQWKESMHIINNFTQQQPEIDIPVMDLDAWRLAFVRRRQKQPKDRVVSPKQN